jgi:ABC-type transport system involved in cytochrome bd biosynthesis fused ATPase/permease subunit
MYPEAMAKTHVHPGSRYVAENRWIALVLAHRNYTRMQLFALLQTGVISALVQCWSSGLDSRGHMNKIAARFLLAALLAGAFVPALASTQKKYPANKYHGIDRASRKAERREQKEMDRAARKQRKAERKMLKTQNKKSTYKPSKPKHF